MNTKLTVLSSSMESLDGSINHVYDDGTEFRLVRRIDHDTVYLSSHKGCNLSCQMCWLTTSGQMQMTPLTSVEMLDRALHTLSFADTHRRINFAFMARGDALANLAVNGKLIYSLLASTQAYNKNSIHAKVTISTIFPQKVVGHDITHFLLSRFGPFQPTLYWSVYSIFESVRKYWLPNAADPDLVACALRKWQDITFQDVVVHHALIEGVNDSLHDASSIIRLLDAHGLRYRVNLVRFNAPPNSQLKEASEKAYDEHLKAYLDATDGRARIQPRVGVDVFASCGMFTQKEA